MSKLPKEHRFLDLSDYGRPIAIAIAKSLQHTSFTPVGVTILFIISGLSAIYSILQGWYWAGAAFLILKSILDAADGELARIKQTPSHTGRYLDSVADIILNLLFLLTIRQITDGSYLWTILAWAAIQLQGTLYNYYYVILRNRLQGDTTSRVFESERPVALGSESQTTVNILYGLYTLLYGIYDKIIYALDRPAASDPLFPRWLMIGVSTFGLGFQLLIMGVFLVVGLAEFIIPFFLWYTVMVPVFIIARRWVVR